MTLLLINIFLVLKQEESQVVNCWTIIMLGKKLSREGLIFLSINLKQIEQYSKIISEYIFEIPTKKTMTNKDKYHIFYTQILLIYLNSFEQNLDTLIFQLKKIFQKNKFCFQINSNPNYTNEAKFGLLKLSDIIKEKFRNKNKNIYSNLVIFIFELSLNIGT